MKSLQIYGKWQADSTLVDPGEAVELLARRQQPHGEVAGNGGRAIHLEHPALVAGADDDTAGAGVPGGTTLTPTALESFVLAPFVPVAVTVDDAWNCASPPTIDPARTGTRNL